MRQINLASIYSRFPTIEDCIAQLETIRWRGKPQCPHCGSWRKTPLVNERRYRCNNCNTNYSVTVKTLFHKTHVDLRKWFCLIALIMESRRKLPAVRWLAQEVEVNKNTVSYMTARIRIAINTDTGFALLTSITDEVTRDD